MRKYMKCYPPPEKKNSCNRDKPLLINTLFRVYLHNQKTIMNQLSKEAFLKVIPLLEIHDQLHCILVCRHWHKVISENNLFGHLDFGKEKVNEATDFKNFHKAILTLVRRKISDSKSRNSLLMEDSTHSFLSLPSIFPSVKHVTLFDTLRNKSSKASEIPSHKRLKQNLKSGRTLKACKLVFK
jgi:hypothetical protein